MSVGDDRLDAAEPVPCEGARERPPTRPPARALSVHVTFRARGRGRLHRIYSAINSAARRGVS